MYLYSQEHYMNMYTNEDEMVNFRQVFAQMQFAHRPATGRVMVIRVVLPAARDMCSSAAHMHTIAGYIRVSFILCGWFCGVVFLFNSLCLS